MDAENPITPQQVAEWMRDEVDRRGYLDQDVAADHIAKNFGKQFTYDNENGNLAIQRTVLNAFKKLTEKTAVWEKGERSWRKRTPRDSPGRMQD
jgi:hypothetical protein